LIGGIKISLVGTVSFLEFVNHQNKVTLDASTDGTLGGGPGLGGFNFINQPLV
jgi:hypothetical protein